MFCKESYIRPFVRGKVYAYLENPPDRTKIELKQKHVAAAKTVQERLRVCLSYQFITGTVCPLLSTFGVYY